MNKETKDQIIEALDSYMATHKLSANLVSAQVGINPSYLSQMRSGKYTVKAGEKEVEIANKYYEMLANYVGFSIEKTYWKTETTPQLLSVMATLEEAKRFGSTAVIIGETGSGKSYSAELFMRANPLDTWMVKVGASDNLGDLLNKVIEEIGIVSGVSKSRKINDIIRTMRSRKENGLKPMIIFDESEYMRPPALWAIKELYDNLLGIASVVMLGTDQLIEHIEKLRKRNRDGIPQLYRRIKFGIRTLPGIDRSYKLFLNEIQPDLRRFLVTNCDNYGELHDVLVPAQREAERTGQPLTENFVRTILNMPKY